MSQDMIPNKTCMHGLPVETYCQECEEGVYGHTKNPQPFRHHNGEIDFPNGDRVRWANGWWMADRKSGETTKHKTAQEAENELTKNPHKMDIEARMLGLDGYGDSDKT